MKEASLASRLRHRITIEEPVLTPDGGGGFTKTWQTVATVWAEITPSRGRESFNHGVLEATGTHRIIIRYRDGITPVMRVVSGSRHFNIRSIINHEEADILLELTVEEGVGT